MPSHKRKQIRKIKKNMKKQVQHIKQKQQQQQQQQQLSPNQEMMMKLMALMSNKVGGQSSMDPATFLNSREKEAKLERDKAKLAKKELKSKNAIEKANRETEELKSELKYIKEKFGIKEQMADVENEMTNTKREHELSMLNKQLEKMGYDRDGRKLIFDIANANQKIALNRADGSIDETVANIGKLNEELASLMLSIDYHNSSSALKKVISVFKNKLAATIVSFNKTVEKFKEHAATDDEIRYVNGLLEKMSQHQANLIEINQTMDMQMREKQNQLNIARDAEKEYLDDQRKNAKLQRDLTRADIELKGSERKHYVDSNGNLIEDYSDKLLPEIGPEHIPKISELYTEYYDILKWLNDMIKNYSNEDSKEDSKNIKEWLSILNARFGANSEYKKEYDKFKQMYEKLPNDQKYQGIDTFEKLASKFTNTMNEWKKMHDDTVSEYEKAVDHNDKIRDSYKEVNTNEAIAIINVKIQKLRDDIESTTQKSKDNKKLINELNSLVRQRDKLQAQIDNTPEPVLTKDDIDKYVNTNNEVENLKRKDQVNKIKQNEINTIKDQTIKQDLNNQVESARLTGIESKQSEYENELKNAIEAQVASEQKQRLIESKRLTHKAEADERQVNMTLNAIESERYKAAEQDIIKEKAKASVKAIEAKQTEQLMQEKHKTRENIRSLEAMKMIDDLTKGSVKADDMIHQLKAINDKIDAAADQYIADNDYVRKMQDKIVQRLDNEPELHLDLVNHFERKGIPQFSNEDDLRNRLSTRQDVDNMNRLLNGLNRPRTPPSMRPSSVFRFYGPDRYTQSTFDGNDETDSDEE